MLAPKLQIYTVEIDKVLYLNQRFHSLPKYRIQDS